MTTAVPSSWVRIGRVGKPHGLDGCFAVEGASDDPARFAVGACVYVARQPARVAESKRAGGRLVVRLDMPVDRGAVIELPAHELPPPDDGSFYVFQLVGLRVEAAAGAPLGHVADVLPGVANDVLELDDGTLLPLVEDWVLEVDLDQGLVVVADGTSAGD